METSRLNNFKKQLKQYDEKFLITNNDNLITATSTKFIEPTIEEKELDLIKFHQQMLKNNNIQLMNKFKETKRNEIKKYNETHSKKEEHKPITPYRQEIINTLKNPDNGFNLALTLNFNPVNLSGLFNLQMVQNKVNEWWKLYCSYTLGRDASKYKIMVYVGFVEHFESNIHAHLSIKHPQKSMTDEFIYDEGQAIKILWKTVQMSGTVFLDRIFSDGWFYYQTKCSDFQNRLIFSPN